MPQPSLNTPRNRTFLSILIIAIVFLATALPAALHDLKPSEKTGDFTHFYHAAESMLLGENIYAQPSWFFNHSTGGYIYPPLIAFLFQPLALMSEHHAAATWVLFNAGFTLLALLLAAKEAATRWQPADRESDPSRLWMIAAFAALLTADKLRAIFTLGQTDCFMLLGFTCALRYMNRKPLLAGLLVGASASIKYLSLICVPYFLLKRNFKAAFSSLFSFAFFMLLPAVQVGLPRAIQYAAAAFGGLAKMLGLTTQQNVADIHSITWERSVSITSAFFRLTRHFQLPDSLAIFLTLLTFTIVILTILHFTRRNLPLFRPSQNSNSPQAEHLEWAILVFTAITFSPQTTLRHMVLMLLIFTLPVALLCSPLASRYRFSLILAIFVMMLGLFLPPPNFENALTLWRAIGGPSWCAIILIITLSNSASARVTAKFLSQKTDLIP